MTSPDSGAPARAARTEPHPGKAPLRARMRGRRAPLPQADADARLARALVLSEGHSVVALYASTGDEPDTWGLIDALHARGVRVLLPLLAGRRTPAWADYAGRDALRPGFRGIPEPTTDPLPPDALGAATLVWCSALAVTPGGDRLGTGGGWYDRALARASERAVLAVLINDAEILAELPTDPWDRRVDWVVSERRTLGPVAARDGAE